VAAAGALGAGRDQLDDFDLNRSRDMTRSWAIGDVRFAPEQLAAAERIVRDDLAGRVGLAFLGGSYAVGLGHATSDVDLYVVGHDLPDHEVVYTNYGVAVHVGSLAGDVVRRLVDLGTEFRCTGAARDQILLDFRTLNALVRLTTGHRLICSPEWSAELAPLRRDVVRQILMTRNANVFAAHAEDVLGALVSGDLFTAAGASAIALEAAAEATLAAADDPYVGPKFLFRRLGRSAVTRDWCPMLWQLLNQAFTDWPADDTTASTDRVRAIAERRLLAGNLLLSWCALAGWEQPLVELPAPPADVSATSRSPYFAPVRFADGWALMGPDDGYAVSEAVVRLWRDTDGTADGPTARTLAMIGALHPSRPVPPGRPTADSGVRLAGRFACHPKAEPGEPE
jgi:hypothetical protein